MAQVDKLAGDYELSMIDRYAQKFHLDPDIVYHKEFNSIFVFLEKWKREGEYYDRYRAAEKSISEMK